jgi:hypothetical protein
MPIDKITPLALNKSLDERLVKQNEMTDARNVTISTDTDGNGFVLKNTKGTTAVQAASAGDKITQDSDFEVLGSCVDLEANTIYFIVYNNTDINHGVYRVDLSQDSLVYEKVYQTRYLFGTKPEFVDMDVIRADVNQEGAIVPILYMTDNVTEPKKLNVSRALDAADAGGYSTEADIKEFLSVAKTKPLHTFQVNSRTDFDFDGNFIYGRSLSFSVQWVYKDGERSALSNMSTCVIPQIYVSQEEDGSRKSGANYYEMSLPKGNSEVSEINVYYRDNETGTIYLADRLKRSSDLVRNGITVWDESASTYLFYGDQDQEPAPLIEANKLFDSVPIRAKTQCIADSRLMYGNYVEGRDLPDVRAEMSVTYDEALNDNFNVISMQASAGPAFAPVSSDEGYQAYAELDFSKVADTIPSGTQFVLDFSFFYNGDISFICFDDGSNTVFEFAYGGNTWETGLNDFEVRLKDLQDIRFKTTYTATTSMSRATLLSNIETHLQTIISTISYVNEDNVGSAANRTSGSAATATFYVKQANFVFFLKPRVTGDTLSVALGYLSSNSATITDAGGTEVTNYSYGTDPSYTGSGIVGGMTSAGYSAVGDGVYSSRTSHLSLLLGGTSTYKSFKRGANHSFGMILYDEKGRSSFVKELGGVYIKDKGELKEETNTNGKASVTISFPQIGGSDQTLPSWVSKYQYVYGGSDIDTFKQYAVSGGFANYWSYSDFDTTDSKEDASKNIYISLKGWSGSNSSYCGENGANYVYNPKEGDILKVLHYDIEDGAGSFTRFFPDDLEFPIVGKTTLRKDTVTDDINAIRAEIDFENKRDDNKQSRRDKRAQKRKDKGKDGPGLKTRIGRGLDKVADKFNEYAEDRPFLDRVFTNRDEKMEDLLDAEEDARDKIKDTPLSSRNPVFPGGRITYDVNGNPNEDSEDMPMAKGEFLILKDTNISGWGRADAVQVNFDTATTPNTIQTTALASDGINKHWFPILNWARNVVVEVYTPGKSKSQRVYTELSEVFDYSTSLPTAGDLIEDGDVWQKRSQVKIFAKETDSTNRAVDHFFRYWDMDGMYFKSMFLESEDGSHFFGSDGSVFGRAHAVNKYASENHRRHSITYSDKYFSDSPFLNLSNFNLSKANYTDLDSSYGGVDRIFPNDGYLSCIQQSKASRIPIGQNRVSLSADTDVLTTADVILGGPSYYAGKYGTRGLTQASVENDGTIYFLDTISKKVFQLGGDGITPISDENMDSFFQNKVEQWSALASPSRVFVGYDPDYDELLVAMNSSGSFEGFVAAYNTKIKKWTSIYEFSDASDAEPTLFESCGNRFISCLYTSNPGTGNGEDFIFHEHTEDVTRARFYSDQKNSIVEVVANFNPSMVKTFEAVALEGNSGTWDAVITTSDQTASITDWEERERGYYAMMPRDTSANSTSHKVAIPGTVAQDTSLVGRIIFSSKIRIPIPYGSEIYNVTKDRYVTQYADGTGDRVTATSVNGKTLNTTAFLETSVVESGDVLYAVLPQEEYGDAIRDYFCKIRLTSSSSNDLELFAINTHYDRSKLGQEKG